MGDGHGAPGRTALLLLFLSTNMTLIKLFMNCSLFLVMTSPLEMLGKRPTMTNEEVITGLGFLNHLLSKDQRHYGVLYYYKDKIHSIMAPLDV